MFVNRLPVQSLGLVRHRRRKRLCVLGIRRLRLRRLPQESSQEIVPETSGSHLRKLQEDVIHQAKGDV